MSDEVRGEAERLKALRAYEILDTPPDGAFDHVTALACRIFQVPISLVSLVDEDRIWFKSRHGLDTAEIPRSPGLCASAMFSDEAYVIKNTLQDPRTLTNPLVAGEMGLRFYAAAPLITHEGFRLGTVNIIDFSPREFGQEDEAVLTHLAGIVMDQMELRIAARQAISSLSKVFGQEWPAQHLEQLITVCAWTKRLRVEEDWFTLEEFLEDKLGMKVTHGIHPEAAKSLRTAPNPQDAPLSAVPPPGRAH